MGGVNTSDSAQPVGDVPADGPAKVPLRIFINYRHEDIPFAAMMLYRELKESVRQGEYLLRRRHAAARDAIPSGRSSRI